MGKSTSKLRQLWKTFECEETRMVVVAFGPDRIRVAPPSAPAWEALAAVLRHHRYDIRTIDTDSFNCSNINGTNQKSLHSYGITLDINWNTNPFLRTPDKRKVRFSNQATQAERGEDVRLGAADTDMTPELIADALAIRTKGGHRVFDWGGSWESVKDSMHFEIDVSSEELATGIDTATVAGWDEPGARPDGDAGPSPGISTAPVPPPAAAGSGDPHGVIARDGLKLRGGPAPNSRPSAPSRPTRSECARPRGAMDDRRSPGHADGFMHLGFLRPVAAVRRRRSHRQWSHCLSR